jgi:hypothetical protein
MLGSSAEEHRSEKAGVNGSNPFLAKLLLFKSII